MPTRVHRPTGLRPSPDLIAQWASVPSTVAADVFRGRTLVDPALRPLRPFAGRGQLTGCVVTAWCEAADYGPVHHAIAVAEPGDVILVEAGGRLDAAMIGELLCGAARRKGIAGVAINGAVRDVGALTQWADFAVFARGAVARGPSSMERGSVNEAIVFGGVPAAPGDLAIGDDDGLVVIPQGEMEGQPLQAALGKVRAEKEWERALAEGQTNLEVFRVPAAISN